MKYFKSYFFKIALCVSILILPCRSFCFQNEPDSFRGIKWGTNINKLSDMECVFHQNDHFKEYKKKNDKMKIGDAEIEKITYHFYKGRLMGVFIRFTGFINYDHLKSTFFQLYGKANRFNQFMEKYYWAGTEVGISIEYNNINKKGFIHYLYKPIRDELMEEFNKNMEKPFKDGPMNYNFKK